MGYRDPGTLGRWEGIGLAWGRGAGEDGKKEFDWLWNG